MVRLPSDRLSDAAQEHLTVSEVAQPLARGSVMGCSDWLADANIDIKSVYRADVSARKYSWDDDAIGILARDVSAVAETAFSFQVGKRASVVSDNGCLVWTVADTRMHERCSDWPIPITNLRKDDSTPEDVGTVGWEMHIPERLGGFPVRGLG